MPAIELLPSLKDDLALIKGAGAEAGRIAMRHFKRDPQVWTKENDSPVSEADFAVDRFLRETLLAERPGYGWLSEETEEDPDRFSRRRSFVVDPIDGTRAFLKGDTTWCVSIAIVEDGVSQVGILDCPALEELFEAVRGEGAQRNGVAISAKGQNEVPSIAGPANMLRELPEKLSIANRKSKHIPSLAYRIAMVADGRLDATFVKPNAHDWDIAAACLLLTETGGRLVGPQGDDIAVGRSSSQHGPMLASQPHLLDDLLPLLQAAHDRI